jgi:hypothetical protein
MDLAPAPFLGDRNDGDARSMTRKFPHPFSPGGFYLILKPVAQSGRSPPLPGCHTRSSSTPHMNACVQGAMSCRLRALRNRHCTFHAPEAELPYTARFGADGRKRLAVWDVRHEPMSGTGNIAYGVVREGLRSRLVGKAMW